MRISLQQLKPLLAARETLIQPPLGAPVAAAKFSSLQVNANNRGLRARNPTEEEERTAAGRADLQGAFRAPGSENLAKGRQLAYHLACGQKVIAANKIH
jgi:hypothetical protein